MSINAVTRSQALLVSAHATRLAISIAVASLLGRGLAAADFGFVALLSSLFVVAVEILDMGTTAAATREIAARPERERESLAALLGLRRLIASALLAAILLVACSDYVPRTDQRLVLVVAALGVFLLHLHALQLVFQLRQDYRPVTTLSVAGQAGFLVACVIALKLHAAGAAIGMLVVAREAFQALGTRVLAVRMLGTRLRARWNDPGMVPLFRAGWMIGTAGLAYKLCAHAGGFILWEVAAPEALASFNAAQRLLAPAADMAWLVATPLLAAMSTTAARDAPALRVQLDGYLKLLVGMSCLVAVAGYFVAPFLLGLIYGDVYSSGRWSAVAPLRWLSLAYLFTLASPVLVVGEMVRGRGRALLFLALACLGANLGANAWAIPRHGAEGAAAVFACSEALFFGVLLVRAVARGDVLPAATWPVYTIPAALLAGLLWLLQGHPAWQLAAACAWAPASLAAMMQLPAQKACRASLSPASIPWNTPQASGSPSAGGAA